MDYLLIDGYNVINAWSDCFDPENEPLEDCRDRLANMLSNYQGFKKQHIILVFDAHMVKGTHHKTIHFDNIKIVFTKENVTADSYIERFVYRMSEAHMVRVVTSDYLEQTIVLFGGGMRITPKEFKLEMDRESKNSIKISKTQGKSTNSISASVTPELMEKLENMRRGHPL